VGGHYGEIDGKKRKWIVIQFRSGRSVTSIARIQKISRQMVYKLVKRHKKDGDIVFCARKSGRPSRLINPNFAAKVIEMRKTTDYGSRKIHIVLRRNGFSVAQRQIQKILDCAGLTDPCLKRRGQRTYVRFQWPISNYMWHCDWSHYKGKEYCVFIDDRSRKIMAAGIFEDATEKNATFVFFQAALTNQVCPVVVLSDKGPQFYANTKTKSGQRPLSEFEKKLNAIGVELWTARRNHPQTNGKMERWFQTMKTRFSKHADETLKDFVRWYNEERIHYSLDDRTPNEAYYENV